MSDVFAIFRQADHKIVEETKKPRQSRGHEAAFGQLLAGMTAFTFCALPLPGSTLSQIAPHPTVAPGLTRGPACSSFSQMNHKISEGWVYIMADRYRGTLYVGVTADLPRRISQHREGSGSDFCARYGLNRLVWAQHCGSIVAAIAHEKRIKRWHRQWKFDLIEQGNPDWDDLFGLLI
jgi:putative endonuclease